MSDTIKIIIAVFVILILLISAILTIYRMVVGPTIFDRAMAADVFLAIFSIAVAAEMIVSGNTENIVLLVVLAVVGFSGSVALSRYAGRRK